MAFSLEAALVVPLALGTWLGLVAAAAPAYCEVRQAARLEVLATRHNLDSGSLYSTESIDCGDAWTTAIGTSPQSVIELGSLIIDDCRLIERLLPGRDQSTAIPGAGS